MFKSILVLLKQSKGISKGVFIFNTINCVLMELIPLVPLFFVKVILDIITKQLDFNILLKTVLFFSIIYFALEFIRAIFDYLGDTKCQDVYLGMDFKFFEQLEKFDYEVFEQNKYLNQIEKGKYFFTSYIHRTLANCIGKIVSFITIVGIIFTLNIWVVLFLVFMFVLNGLFTNKINLKIYKLNLQKIPTERKIDYLKRLLKERDFGKEIRINNLKNHFLTELENEQKTIIKKEKTIININNLISANISSIINFLQNFIAYLYAGISVFLGHITIGSFTMYIQAISKFSNSLVNLINIVTYLKQVAISYNDYLALEQIPQKMQQGGKELENPQNSKTIEFKNVSFKYPNNETYILKNINIKINKGEKLAIVGENGAGKTTFIKLLIRLYDVTEGEILLDGVNIKQLNYKSYMNALSVVFQDFKLFYTTIKENVALSKTDIATDKEIIDILEKSGLKENMKKFDKGINTILYKEFDDEGVELSGGEAQKLCIARALYKNGGIVILDEPTAALDPRSEYDIYTRFDELVKNKTAIYISHRLSSTRFCDKIAVFENGEIVEYGTHNELIKNDGIYNELYSKQAQFYK